MPTVHFASSLQSVVYDLATTTTKEITDGSHVTRGGPSSSFNACDLVCNSCADQKIFLSAIQMTVFVLKLRSLL